MKKIMPWLIVAALIVGVTSCTSCTSNHDNAPSVELSEFIPKAPDYKVTGYSASEYSPYKDLINVGDIHSCEPWLYSECLAKNIAVRTKKWREKSGN
ncbi:MAG: hypothetical protein IJ929_03875 [Prevotella sp.]|nr:hypothetical protein [Prevotella sp.]